MQEREKERGRGRRVWPALASQGAVATERRERR